VNMVLCGGREIELFNLSLSGHVVKMCICGENLIPCLDYDPDRDLPQKLMKVL